MTILDLSDSMWMVAFKMSQGDPEAMAICVDLINRNGEIDPSGIPRIQSLLYLDSMGLYGPKIVSLYRVCHSELVSFIAVVRAWQLGHLRKQQVVYAIDRFESGHPTSGLDIEGVLAFVRGRLPNFSGAPKEDSWEPSSS